MCNLGLAPGRIRMQLVKDHVPYHIMPKVRQIRLDIYFVILCFHIEVKFGVIHYKV